MSQIILKKLFLVKNELSNPKPNAEANRGSFKYDYLDLSGLLEHVSPSLKKHGLALIQPISDGKLNTILFDNEGESFVTHIDVPKDLTAQELGSWITYNRRYSIACLLGVSTDKDDDGQLATTAKHNQTQKQENKPYSNQYKQESFKTTYPPRYDGTR